MASPKGLRIAPLLIVPAFTAIACAQDSGPGQSPREGPLQWEPISYLALSGSLTDKVSGGQLVFARDSIAFNRDGSVVSPGTMRTEQFAVEAGRSFEFITPSIPNLRPFVADGNSIYGATSRQIHSSADGHTWSLVGEAPGYVRSIFVTRTGAILVGAGGNGDARVYRVAPDGGPLVPVLDLELGKPMQRNYIDTGTYIFVSEYGPRFPPNTRRIYRSADDGLTWELVYDPEYRYTHDHKLVWDPYDQRILQTTGDGAANDLLITSDDLGETWQVDRVHFPTLPSLDQGGPTAALARPEAVYWGLDGGGPTGVQRHVRGTGQRGSGRWETTLAVGFDYPPHDDQFDGNVYDLAEHEGLIWAPFTQVHANPLHNAPALYTSADGQRWALAKRFGSDEGGPYHFLGTCNGRLWIRYLPTFDKSFDNRLLAVETAGIHRLVRGTRLEGAVTNLWNTPETSSAEGTLEGWDSTNGAALEIDANLKWHGRQSVHVTCAEAAAAGIVFPTGVGNMSAGETVSVALHVYGSPRGLILDILDDTGTRVARSQFEHMSQCWSQAFCTGRLRADTSSLTVKLRQRLARPALDFRVDGAMLSVGPGGDTWQLGGQARAADRLVYDFTFPAVWTDLFLWAPDRGTGGPVAPARTVKVYEANGGGTLSVVYDPADRVIRLVDSSDPTATVETPRFLLAQSAVLRIGVVQSTSTRTLFVKIAEDPYIGTGTANPRKVIRMHFGADVNGQNASGGIHARHKLFDQAADAEQLDQLFVELIQEPD